MCIRDRRKSLLSGSTDWKLLVDYFDRPIVLPPEILATSQRPDIVIWSVALKKDVMIELTCPAEEGIEAARERKLGRYTQLKQGTEEVGWVAGLLTKRSVPVVMSLTLLNAALDSWACRSER